MYAYIQLHIYTYINSPLPAAALNTAKLLTIATTCFCIYSRI